VVQFLAHLVTIVPCKSAVSEIGVGVSDRLLILSTSIHSECHDLSMCQHTIVIRSTL